MKEDQMIARHSYMTTLRSKTRYETLIIGDFKSPELTSGLTKSRQMIKQNLLN